MDVSHIAHPPAVRDAADVADKNYAALFSHIKGLSFAENERIVYLYVSSKTKGESLVAKDISSSILLTTHRLLQIDKNSVVASLPYGLILSIETQEKKGLFSKSTITCELRGKYSGEPPTVSFILNSSEVSLQALPSLSSPQVSLSFSDKVLFTWLAAVLEAILDCVTARALAGDKTTPTLTSSSLATIPSLSTCSSGLFATSPPTLSPVPSGLTSPSELSTLTLSLSLPVLFPTLVAETVEQALVSKLSDVLYCVPDASVAVMVNKCRVLYTVGVQASQDLTHQHQHSHNGGDVGASMKAVAPLLWVSRKTEAEPLPGMFSNNPDSEHGGVTSESALLSLSRACSSIIGTGSVTDPVLHFTTPLSLKCTDPAALISLRLVVSASIVVPEATVALIRDLDAAVDSDNSDEDVALKAQRTRARTVLHTVQARIEAVKNSTAAVAADASNSTSSTPTLTSTSTSTTDEDLASAARQRLARDLLSAAHTQEVVLCSASTIAATCSVELQALQAAPFLELPLAVVGAGTGASAGMSGVNTRPAVLQAFRDHIKTHYGVRVDKKSGKFLGKVGQETGIPKLNVCVLNGVVLSMVGQDTFTMRQIVEEGVPFRYAAATDAVYEEDPAHAIATAVYEAEDDADDDATAVDWDAPVGRGRSTATVLNNNKGNTAPPSSLALTSDGTDAGAVVASTQAVTEAAKPVPYLSMYSALSVASSVASAASSAVYSASNAVYAASAAVTTAVGGALSRSPATAAAVTPSGESALAGSGAADVPAGASADADAGSGHDTSMDGEGSGSGAAAAVAYPMGSSNPFDDEEEDVPEQREEEASTADAGAGTGAGSSDTDAAIVISDTVSKVIDMFEATEPVKAVAESPEAEVSAVASDVAGEAAIAAETEVDVKVKEVKESDILSCSPSLSSRSTSSSNSFNDADKAAGNPFETDADPDAAAGTTADVGNVTDAVDGAVAGNPFDETDEAIINPFDDSGSDTTADSTAATIPVTPIPATTSPLDIETSTDATCTTPTDVATVDTVSGDVGGVEDMSSEVDVSSVQRSRAHALAVSPNNSPIATPTPTAASDVTSTTAVASSSASAAVSSHATHTSLSTRSLSMSTSLSTSASTSNTNTDSDDDDRDANGRGDGAGRDGGEDGDGVVAAGNHVKLIAVSSRRPRRLVRAIAAESLSPENTASTQEIPDSKTPGDDSGTVSGVLPHLLNTCMITDTVPVIAQATDPVLNYNNQIPGAISQWEYVWEFQRLDSDGWRNPGNGKNDPFNFSGNPFGTVSRDLDDRLPNMLWEWSSDWRVCVSPSVVQEMLSIGAGEEQAHTETETHTHTQEEGQAVVEEGLGHAATSTDAHTHDVVAAGVDDNAEHSAHTEAVLPETTLPETEDSGKIAKPGKKNKNKLRRGLLGAGMMAKAVAKAVTGTMTTGVTKVTGTVAQNLGKVASTLTHARKHTQKTATYRPLQRHIVAQPWGWVVNADMDSLTWEYSGSTPAGKDKDKKHKSKGDKRAGDMPVDANAENQGFHRGYMPGDVLRRRCWARPRRYLSQHYPGCPCEYCEMMLMVAETKLAGEGGMAGDRGVAGVKGARGGVILGTGSSGMGTGAGKGGVRSMFHDAIREAHQMLVSVALSYINAELGTEADLLLSENPENTKNPGKPTFSRSLLLDVNWESVISKLRSVECVLEHGNKYAHILTQMDTTQTRTHTLTHLDTNAIARGRGVSVASGNAGADDGTGVGVDMSSSRDRGNSMALSARDRASTITRRRYTVTAWVPPSVYAEYMGIKRRVFTVALAAMYEYLPLIAPHAIQRYLSAGVAPQDCCEWASDLHALKQRVDRERRRSSGARRASGTRKSSAARKGSGVKSNGKGGVSSNPFDEDVQADYTSALTSTTTDNTKATSSSSKNTTSTAEDYDYDNQYTPNDTTYDDDDDMSMSTSVLSAQEEALLARAALAHSNARAVCGLLEGYAKAEKAAMQRRHTTVNPNTSAGTATNGHEHVNTSTSTSASAGRPGVSVDNAASLHPLVCELTAALGLQIPLPHVAAHHARAHAGKHASEAVQSPPGDTVTAATADSVGTEAAAAAESESEDFLLGPTWEPIAGAAEAVAKVLLGVVAAFANPYDCMFHPITPAVPVAVLPAQMYRAATHLGCGSVSAGMAALGKPVCLHPDCIDSALRAANAQLHTHHTTHTHDGQLSWLPVGVPVPERLQWRASLDGKGISAVLQELPRRTAWLRRTLPLLEYLENMLVFPRSWKVAAALVRGLTYVTTVHVQVAMVASGIQVPLYVLNPTVAFSLNHGYKDVVFADTYAHATQQYQKQLLAMQASQSPSSSTPLTPLARPPLPPSMQLMARVGPHGARLTPSWRVPFTPHINTQVGDTLFEHPLLQFAAARDLTLQHLLAHGCPVPPPQPSPSTAPQRPMGADITHLHSPLPAGVAQAALVHLLESHKELRLKYKRMLPMLAPGIMHTHADLLAFAAYTHSTHPHNHSFAFLPHAVLPALLSPPVPSLSLALDLPMHAFAWTVRKDIVSGLLDDLRAATQAELAFATAQSLGLPHTNAFAAHTPAPMAASASARAPGPWKGHPLASILPPALLAPPATPQSTGITSFFSGKATAFPVLLDPVTHVVRALGVDPYQLIPRDTADSVDFYADVDDERRDVTPEQLSAALTTLLASSAPLPSLLNPFDASLLLPSSCLVPAPLASLTALFVSAKKRIAAASLAFKHVPQLTARLAADIIIVIHAYACHLLHLLATPFAHPMPLPSPAKLPQYTHRAPELLSPATTSAKLFSLFKAENKPAVGMSKDLYGPAALHYWWLGTEKASPTSGLVAALRTGAVIPPRLAPLPRASIVGGVHGHGGDGTHAGMGASADSTGYGPVTAIVSPVCTDYSLAAFTHALTSGLVSGVRNDSDVANAIRTVAEKGIIVGKPENSGDMQNPGSSATSSTTFHKRFAKAGVSMGVSGDDEEVDYGMGNLHAHRHGNVWDVLPWETAVACAVTAHTCIDMTQQLLKYAQDLCGGPDTFQKYVSLSLQEFSPPPVEIPGFETPDDSEDPVLSIQDGVMALLNQTITISTRSLLSILVPSVAAPLALAVSKYSHLHAAGSQHHLKYHVMLPSLLRGQHADIIDDCYPNLHNIQRVGDVYGPGTPKQLSARSSPTLRSVAHARASPGTLPISGSPLTRASPVQGRSPANATLGTGTGLGLGASAGAGVSLVPFALDGDDDDDIMSNLTRVNDTHPTTSTTISASASSSSSGNGKAASGKVPASIKATPASSRAFAGAGRNIRSSISTPSSTIIGGAGVGKGDGDGTVLSGVSADSKISSVNNTSDVENGGVAGDDEGEDADAMAAMLSYYMSMADGEGEDEGEDGDRDNSNDEDGDGEKGSGSSKPELGMPCFGNPFDEEENPSGNPFDDPENQSSGTTNPFDDEEPQNSASNPFDDDDSDKSANNPFVDDENGANHDKSTTSIPNALNPFDDNDDNNVDSETDNVKENENTVNNPFDDTEADVADDMKANTTRTTASMSPVSAAVMDVAGTGANVVDADVDVVGGLSSVISSSNPFDDDNLADAEVYVNPFANDDDSDDKNDGLDDKNDELAGNPFELTDDEDDESSISATSLHSLSEKRSGTRSRHNDDEAEIRAETAVMSLVEAQAARDAEGVDTSLPFTISTTAATHGDDEDHDDDEDKVDPKAEATARGDDVEAVDIGARVGSITQARRSSASTAPVATSNSTETTSAVVDTIPLSLSSLGPITIAPNPHSASPAFSAATTDAVGTVGVIATATTSSECAYTTASTPYDLASLSLLPSDYIRTLTLSLLGRTPDTPPGASHDTAPIACVAAALHSLRQYPVLLRSFTTSLTHRLLAPAVTAVLHTFALADMKRIPLPPTHTAAAVESSLTYSQMMSILASIPPVLRCDKLLTPLLRQAIADFAGIYTLSLFISTGNSENVPPLLTQSGPAGGITVHHVKDYQSCLKSVTSQGKHVYSQVKLTRMQERYQHRVFSDLLKALFPIDLLFRASAWIFYICEHLSERLANNGSLDDVMPSPIHHTDDGECTCVSCSGVTPIVTAQPNEACMKTHLAALFSMLHRAGIGHTALQWAARMMNVDYRTAALIATLYVPHAPIQTRKVLVDF